MALRYRFFDGVLESSFELPQLVRTNSPLANHVVTMSTEPVPVSINTRYLELEDGTRWATLASGPDFYTLDVSPHAVFCIGHSGHDIICHPSSGLPELSLGNLLLNQVLPLAVAHAGRFVLHASGCLLPEGAVAFLGAAGRGKSTLAASFRVDGFPLVSDDALLLDFDGTCIKAIGSYPDLRLWADSMAELFPSRTTTNVAHYSKKRRLGLKGRLNFHMDPAPLRRVYLLERESDIRGPIVSIEALHGADAAIAVFRHVYRLALCDWHRCHKDQELISTLVNKGVVRRLRFQTEYAFLGAVREAIQRDAQLN